MNSHVLLLVLNALIIVPTYSQYNEALVEPLRLKLEVFMETPVELCGLLRHYRELGGFPHDMHARDRDLTLRYQYSQALQKDVTVYYGLEDGTFLSYSDDITNVRYREPGESGFSIGEDGRAVDPVMQKYWDACVNTNSGASENCVLTQGGAYIKMAPQQQPGEVPLVKCPDEASQVSCLEEYGDNYTAFVECLTKVKHCPDYTIEIANDTTNTFGYVPRTEYCISPNGYITQEQSNVMLNFETNSIGDCRFGDGTLVRRELEGDYAFCGDSVCNSTFSGGFKSRNYDPRYRGWYITTKLLQKNQWSQPYLFFSNNEMGITYADPMYTTDDNGRRVFDGVLAVDYRLSDITRFLVETYANTEYLAVIYEDLEPNGVIGLSTGASVTRRVLASNNTLPCPENSDEVCEDKSVAIQNIGSLGGAEDRLFTAAYYALLEAGFPIDTLVTVEVPEDRFSIFSAQSHIYEQENSNLRWRIIIVAPIARSTQDFIWVGGDFFGAVLSIILLGFFLCFLMFATSVFRRQNKAFIFSDWRLLAAFLLGSALTNLAGLANLGFNTEASCIVRMWAVPFAYTATLSPLYVKIYRMYRLVGASASFRRVTISNRRAFILCLPMVVGQVVILVFETLLDPARPTESLKINSEGVLTQHVVCEGKDQYWYIRVAYQFLLVAIGCVLAFLTRNLSEQFGEARQLMFAMYNVAFSAILLATMYALVEMEHEHYIVLESVSLFWSTVFSCAVFIVPRLVQAENERMAAASPKSSTPTQRRASAILDTKSMATAPGFRSQFAHSHWEQATAHSHWEPSSA